MITNDTIRKVVMNKALFPCKTSYAKRATAGALCSFETNCEMPLDKAVIGVPYNAENSFSSLSVVQTGTNITNNKISLLPIQSGTGDPSLINVRPITAPLSFEMDDESIMTVYGGSLNVLTGELVVNWKQYAGSWTQYASSNSFKAYRSTATDRSKTSEALCNKISEYGSFSSASMTKNIIQLPVNSVTNFYMALDENEDPSTIQLVYELYTPDTIQLSKTELSRALTSLGATTYTIDLGETCYGVSNLDPLNGTGTGKDENGDDITLSFEGITITTLNGINNIWVEEDNSSMAIKYLVSKGIVCNNALQYFPIFYPDTVERSEHHDYR